MFVTFEGIEGAGKSTMLERLAGVMQSRGDTPVLTREPGGSSLGRRLRAMLLDCRREPVSSKAELFLFLADRAQHLADVIRPALQAGQSVLCDRYIDSTLAYQGYGRGMDLESLEQAALTACDGQLPDVTILLDLPVSIGLARAGRRNSAEGTVISEGRFDSESLEFHERVRKGYLELAHASPDRIIVVEADGEPDAVFSECLRKLEKKGL